MPSDPDFVATGPSSSMFYTSYSQIMRCLDIVMEGQNLIEQSAHCIYPFDVMMERAKSKRSISALHISKSRHALGNQRNCRYIVGTHPSVAQLSRF
jgi:hypothetical protein